LFESFCGQESVRFEEFTDCWRKMNFNAIFSCTERSTAPAKMRVAERLFRIASEYLSAEATFLHRVASIYCLYAVYFKQLTDPKVKIRMTPAMWKDLMEFLEVVTAHQHLDVAYVINKLRLMRAFVFTAATKHLTFGRAEFMLGVEGKSCYKFVQQRDQYIQDIIEEKSTIRELAKIQAEYDEVRLRVLAESQDHELTNLKKNLCVSHSAFPQEMEKIIDTHSNQYHLSTILKPPDEKSQRPVLVPVEKSYATETGLTSESLEVEGEDHDEEEEIVKKEVNAERANYLRKLKEKSFRSGKNTVNDETEERTRRYFKRSAMVQPYFQRGWERKQRAKHQKVGLKQEP